MNNPTKTLMLLVGRPKGKEELIKVCEDNLETVDDFIRRYPNLTADGHSSWDYLEVRRPRRGRGGYEVIDSQDILTTKENTK
jgi:hypothetical protein